MSSTDPGKSIPAKNAPPRESDLRPPTSDLSHAVPSPDDSFDTALNRTVQEIYGITLAPAFPDRNMSNNYRADEFNPYDQDRRRILRAKGLDPSDIPGPDIDLIDPATIDIDPNDPRLIGTDYAIIIAQAKQDRAKGIPWPGPLLKQSSDSNKNASQRLAAPQREARPRAPEHEDVPARASPRSESSAAKIGHAGPQAPGPVFDPKPLNPWLKW